MAAWLALAFSGFVAWWGTGIDDTLAFSLLLKGRSRPVKAAMIAGNVLGVVLILLLASLAVLGAISIAPGLLEAKLIGVPVQNLVGVLPIAIGIRALVSHDDDDYDEQQVTVRGMIAPALLGLQVYLVNSFDDLSVHLGVLSSTVSNAAELFAAYWFGTLVGELTSVLSAHWLANRMQARRRLEVIAAVGVVIIGFMVLLGFFEQLF
jgi:cadmium resistance protein CadD (predicted permease)